MKKIKLFHENKKKKKMWDEFYTGKKKKLDESGKRDY